MNKEQFAKLVQERPDLAKYFQFIPSGRDGRRAYYRRIPKTYYDVSARPRSQLRTQLEFTKITNNLYHRNLRGLKDGLPLAASEVRNKMRGRRFKLPPWEEAILKLTRAFKEVKKVVRESKVEA